MIPERYRQTCEFCNQELDVRAEGSHRFVEGWVKQRSGGGGHAIALPLRKNRWAHPWCIDKATRGTLKQVSMFE